MPKVRYGARSLDELRNREIEATKVDTWATTLVGVYESDPDAIRAVLPPFLTPADEPLIRVLVATVDMGGGYPIFGAGSFSVACRHEEVEGDYALVMPMTTEQAVVGGRETFGEPKKLAEIALTRDGDQVSGSFTRMGTTFVEISGRVSEELEPTPETTRTAFYLKFLPSPSGKGFDGEPVVIHCRRNEKTRKLWKVDGEVMLRESRFDPVIDLPVLKLRSLELGERSSNQTAENVGTIPADWVMPYVHQRYDDLSPLAAD
jgi:acetoacetate decarboxylase